MRVVIGLALVLGACSLLTDLSDLRDASTSDAASDAPSDAAADGPVNLLANPGFEDGLGGCGIGWSGGGATLTRSTVAHSGASSCQVCSITNGQITGTVVPTTPVAGDSYFVEAWLHIADAAPNPPYTEVFFEVRDNLADGSASTQPVYANPLTDNWVQSNGTAQIGADGVSLGFDFVTVGGSDGGCLLIDDVTLIKQ